MRESLYTILQGGIFALHPSRGSKERDWTEGLQPCQSPLEMPKFLLLLSHELRVGRFVLLG